jgi:hypothetical protein
MKFIKQYNISNIISTQKVSDNPTFDKFIIKVTFSKQELEKIVNDLTLSDFYPTLSVKGSVGLGLNQYISSEERQVISAESKKFMENGIKDIVESNVGIKEAECRNILHRLYLLIFSHNNWRKFIRQLFIYLIN